MRNVCVIFCHQRKEISLEIQHGTSGPSGFTICLVKLAKTIHQSRHQAISIPGIFHVIITV